MYLVHGDPEEPSALFTGDTLFVGGCGRFFEGSGEDMYKALFKTLAPLPNDTRVYCGHEYTVSNLRFALRVDPGNKALKNKLTWAETQRKAKRFTVPSTLGEERSYNPFMRVHLDAIKLGLGLPLSTSPIDTMNDLRSLKDSF